MTAPTPKPPTAATTTPDERMTRAAVAHLSIHLENTLRPLTNADRNRVLLALHAQIGEQLDALATTTHD